MFRDSSVVDSAGIADYFPFIFQDRPGAVLILSGYFDESERNDGGKPICVAGFLFKEAGYKKFRHKWHRDVLLDGSLPNFHMTDLCAGQGVYRGMSIPTRQVILNGAVDAIRKHTYATIAVQFDRAEFAASVPPEWPTYRGSIYSAAATMCVQIVGFWLNEWGCPMDVLYVFERGHRYQAQADRMLKAIAADGDARSRFRYRNHMFEPKSEYGLQAADLLAWTVTKVETSRGNPTQAIRPFLPAITRLVGPSVSRAKVYLFTGERLRRFLAEQAEAKDGIPVDFGPGKRALM